MKIIGITGGIGSGKSTVAKRIETHGYPVYNSDIRAKKLMTESLTIQQTLKKWYGNGIYTPEGELNRKQLAKEVFGNAEKLKALNELVHPEVFKDFDTWKNQWGKDLVFKETAILFESGSYRNCDAVITVSASVETRIQRALQRDNSSREEIEQRISKQWTDAQREEKADYILYNNHDLQTLYTQVDTLVKKLAEIYE